MNNLVNCPLAYERVFKDLVELADLQPNPDTDEGRLYNKLAKLIEKYDNWALTDYDSSPNK